jgi:excisionase family DNA binding protein
LGQVSLHALAPEAAKGPLLMRVKDAAALLGVHRATIWRLVKASRLETVELLGSLRVRRADVEALAGGHGALERGTADHGTTDHRTTEPGNAGKLKAKIGTGTEGTGCREKAQKTQRTEGTQGT